MTRHLGCRTKEVVVAVDGGSGHFRNFLWAQVIKQVNYYSPQLVNVIEIMLI
ncbi:hypothetical protein HanHA300_Chr07g0233591 [Helianthus annuus]|nr:hypothetical protein HanHA300_Chr07g0233591 [Helianthus annuus]KAJ0562384.1 hypothetical protein HanHA89_Chr07g0250761 [Helianthus annuus]KAJ0727759.1 hypothetical protein HanLR1_Chr07g0233521 [Helianthus annuus]